MARELTESEWQQIDAELSAGRKIQAIKLHREFTDSSLLDAKNAVEDREKELVASRRMSPRDKSGCLGVLLLVTAAAVSAAWVLVR